MNPLKIESNAVSKLNDALNCCDRISANISTNDKTPSLDGTIYLYKSSNLTKDNIQGMVSIQVKGKRVENKDLTKKEIRYQVEIADLKNFRNVGGAIFFVVCMSDFNHSTIYYNPLLPFDLEKLLSTKGRQEQVTLPFKQFPQDMLHITYLISSIINDSRKQHSTANYSINNAKISNFESIIISHDHQFSMDYLFKEPKYAYGKIPGFDIEVPFSKINIETLSKHNLQIQVKLDDVILCNKIDIEHNSETIIIKIGAGCSIDINAKKINFVEIGTLDERILTLQLLLGLLSGKKLKVDNIFTCNKVNIDNYDQNEIESTLSLYISIKSMLQKLKVNKDLAFDELSHESQKTLAIFSNAILNQVPVSLDVQKDKYFMSRFRIANIVIGIFGEKTDNGDYIIENLFNQIDGRCVIAKDKIEKGFEGSIYLFLRKPDFLELSNICYDTITKSLLAVPYSKEYEEQLNLFSLEMLSAYDEQINPDNELINSVITIAKWLSCKKSDTQNIYVLNYLQALRRIKPLEIEDIQILHSMKEKEIKKRKLNFSVLSAISILLGNHADFEYYFNKMTLNDQEIFKKYPIYTLHLKGINPFPLLHTNKI